MAAAYGALVSLMNTLEQIKNHALISTFFDEEQLESVGQRVEFLLDFIEKNSSHGGNDGLEKRIASAAYEAEGVIESHIADQIRADERSSSIFLADLQKIEEEMDCIKEETIKVREERRSQDEQKPASSIPAAAAAASWRAHQTRMVGFDEELNQVMDVLTREESSRQIISVVGMGGIGKSTLVRNVFANFITMDPFDVHAWASVTQKYSARGILNNLLVSLKQKAAGETVHELGEKLHRYLYKRRYLIVLDDVWDVKVWNEIMRYFPDDNNRSRIVLTTRLLDVANHCSSYYFSMDLLDEDRSWILFCETVFGCEDCPPELEEVGKEISKLCQGLPLSIVVVGGLLRRSNKTIEYWNNVAKNINSVIWSDEEVDCYKILSLSYSQLDVHLKPCFVCMGNIFEEGGEIRASRIIKVWVAEGFIKPKGAQTLEKIAEGYLNELVERNLVAVDIHRFDGEIGSCLVHDLIRDACLRKYKEDGFFCVGRALGIEREPRIISHEFMPSDNFILDLVKNSLICLVVIVLLRKLPLGAMHRLLRVLNMVDSSLESIIFKNLNVRFLTYQRPNIYRSSIVLIPSSASLIWNLQTLAIFHFHGYQPDLLRKWLLVVAPLEIWNSQQLRHVECYRIHIPDPPRNVRPVVLENLQTLRTAVNLRLSEELCKRIPNVNKLYVTYDFYAPGFDRRWCDHLHNLGSLHKLRSLKLISNRITLLTRPSFRAGWRKCTFPTSLKKLKLVGCLIDWNDLTIIGSLPHLEVLKLQYGVSGQNWSPANEEFLSLKFLSIVNCDLRCWNADSSHFPVLEQLILEELRYLEEIPPDIGEIPTLELIYVYGCGKSAHISAEKIKEEQEDQGNEVLHIQSSTPCSLIDYVFPVAFFSRDRSALLCLLLLCVLFLSFYLYQRYVTLLRSPYDSLCVGLWSVVIPKILKLIMYV